ncbi:MAG: hypothetical protein CVU11_11075 [Bacteroidetes bacterium HGW-Bacteroidetes-6]|jgi:DNA repair protein RadC|nr:MAG: hypothetical protein CVU11_11075 [Bacteroidetes bacterium HGW-Bacteroidetes-6]
MEISKKKSIKDWAADDRPREKMLSKGPEALSDAELLAILIGSGTPQKSALELGRELLYMADNSLKKLSRFSVHQIKKIKGLGSARAVAIEAALELSRRRQSEPADEETVVGRSADAFRFIQPFLRDKQHEEFHLMCLNQRNKIIAHFRISDGGISYTSVDIRKIMKLALDSVAVAIIIAHNHPSGNLSPSENDIKLTNRIAEAAFVLDIKLLDHIIVANDEYTSFTDDGLIKN